MLLTTWSLNGSRRAARLRLTASKSRWTRPSVAAMAGRFSRAGAATGPTTRPSLDPLERRQGERSHLRGQGDVAELTAQTLAVSEAPRDELLQSHRPLVIGITALEQEPAERHDRIGIGAVGIGEEQPEIARHLGRVLGQGHLSGRFAGSDEASSPVLQVRHGESQAPRKVIL